MENNNNGKGIFYGVIGIATLIVAIIGATFAYFTATAQSDNAAINVTSYTGFNVSLSMEKLAPTAAVNKLIPLDDTLLPNALDGNNGKGLCIDNNNDQVCSIYKMTLANTGGAAEIVGYLEATENTYTTTNLKYQIYTTTAEGDTNHEKVFTSLGAAVNAPVKGADVSTLPKFTLASGTDDDTVLSIGEGSAGSPVYATYYLVIWLDDTGLPQNDDIGKTFLGRVTFNAVNGSAGTLQATFTS